MARIENTGEVECHEGRWRVIHRFVGNGWARVPLDWVYNWQGKFEPVIFHGNLWLRILYVEREFPDWLCVVESGNWRWPVWWILFRLWRFVRWFERNLRLTARIWGLLKHDDLACEWRWRDFVLLWWIKKKPRSGAS